MYTLKQLEIETYGKIINGDYNTTINIFSGKNKINQSEKYYFYVPIIFKKENREKYILKHVKNGCIGFMISRNSEQYQNIIKEAKEINPRICIIEVEDVNKSLYKLAQNCRERNLNKPVVAITGSVGKTTICSLISQILSTEINLLHDFKNNNDNTDTLISLSYLNFDHYDMAVTEIGIANIGKMRSISQLVKPSIAVINSIGTAHIDNLKSKENILQEKMHITDDLKDNKILFLNIDDDYLKTVKESRDYKLKPYSLEEAKEIIQKDGKISFTVKIYKKETRFNLNLYGAHYVRDIILAIKIAEIYNIKYENIVKVINNFKPINGRFKVYENKQKEIILIDDTYNSCWESIINGLKVSNEMKSNRKIAVLGTIAQSPNGKEGTSKLHEQLGEYFKNLNFDYLYLLGDYTKHIFKGALKAFLEKSIKRYKTKELLVEQLEKEIKEGDLIYIKDAGLQGFEEIINRLKVKIVEE